MVMAWWFRNPALKLEKSFLPLVLKVCIINASHMGCGRVLYTLSVQGTWQLEEAQLLISILEQRIPTLLDFSNAGSSDLTGFWLGPEEWSLHPEVFQNLCCRWGMPDIDLLLTSRFNTKLRNFHCRSRDPLAIEVDAQVFSWDQFNLLYYFPPLKLLPRLLCRIEVAGIPIIIIAPNWPRQIRWTWTSPDTWWTYFGLPQTTQVLFQKLVTTLSKRT